MSEAREPRSDALAFFGATGDLAYKKIFPALHSMARRGHLNFPVVGVAKSGWTLDRLQYVDGDYSDPATYEGLRKALGNTTHPAHYLAIPPSLFATVVEGLAK